MIIELYIFANKVKKLLKTCLNPSSMTNTILLDFLSFFYDKGRCITSYEQIKVFDFEFFCRALRLSYPS